MRLDKEFRDIELLQTALEKAKGNSVGDNIDVERVVRTMHVGNVKDLIKGIVGLVLIGSLAIGGVKIIQDTVKNNNANIEAKRIIYSLTVGEIGSIVSNHTVVNPENRKDYYYQHNEIALDLIKLSEIEPLFFDYAFGDVCNSMGTNMNNKINTGRTNIDEVIYNLRVLSDKGSYVGIEFRDINSLDDYLIKHNYVTNGLKDYNKFLKENEDMVNDVIAIYEIVKNKEGNMK